MSKEFYSVIINISATSRPAETGRSADGGTGRQPNSCAAFSPAVAIGICSELRPLPSSVDAGAEHGFTSRRKTAISTARRQLFFAANF